jgi:hypothetical protein
MKNRTQKSKSATSVGSVVLWLGILAGFTLSAGPQTIVCGDIYGTWSPALNPYIASCDCTVPAGKTLPLQPGVVFMIGSNVSVTANGLIQAVGTPTQRITIQAPLSSQYWNYILMNYQTAGTNRFNYCDFRNAQAALEPV